MVQRIKQVLLAQYIGAIVIALLSVDVVTGIIKLILIPLSFYLAERTRRGQPPTPLDPGGPLRFPWGSYLPTATGMVLQLLVIWVLFAWLYVRDKPPVVEDQTEQLGGNDANA